MVKFVGNRILLGNKIEGCVLRHITVGWCTLHHYCYNMLLMSKLINVNIFWIAVHAFQSYEYIFSPYTYFVCCRFLQFFDAQKCSSLFGCGVRSTSITSSCRLPSTALGRRGTLILTTARGKFLSYSAGFLGCVWLPFWDLLSDIVVCIACFRMERQHRITMVCRILTNSKVMLEWPLFTVLITVGVLSEFETHWFIVSYRPAHRIVQSHR